MYTRFRYPAEGTWKRVFLHWRKCKKMVQKISVILKFLAYAFTSLGDSFPLSYARTFSNVV